MTQPQHARDSLPDLLARARTRSPHRARALAKLVTRLETNPASATELPAMPPDPVPWVLGVTGPPGVGKSSLVAELITHWRCSGAEVVVLAIDPTSVYSGGAFLGDRVRLTEHSCDPGVFVRSLATRGALGGLSATTSAVLAGVMYAGCDVVVVETVGVGQTELDVAGLADTTLALLAPGLGDSMQAAKAGLMEVADIFAIHQADKPNAHQTLQQVSSALRLSRKADTPVVTSSLRAEPGITSLVHTLDEARAAAQSRPANESSPTGGQERLVRDALATLLWRDVRGSATVRAVMERVNRGEMSVWKAAGVVAEEIVNGTP